MSKELAPLLAGRDQMQAKPIVYRGSKEGSIDGWILVMRPYLQRTQAKAIPDDERDTPEKVFELLASRFGTGGNRMPVRQAFTTRQQSDRKDWMQYLDALEGLRSQGFPEEPVTTNVTKSSSALLRVFVIPSYEGNCPSSMHLRPLLANLPR